MSLLIKFVLRKENIFGKNDCKLFSKLKLLSVQPFSCPYFVHHKDMPCQHNQYSSHLRMFTKNNHDRTTDPKTVIFSKVLTQRKLKRRKIQDALENHKRRLKKNVQQALEERRMSLVNTRRKIQERGKSIMLDIKEKKDKMKEQFEDVFEKENIYTIPNLICVTRIGFSPLLSYFIITGQFKYALAVMTISGVSDWIDGWIARNYESQSSKIGSFLDPMADKILIGTLFLSLTYVDLIPAALTGLILSRDIILIIAGFIIRYRSLPTPRTVSRYFDVTHATAQLAPTYISKVNTGIQLALVGTTLAAPIFGYVNHDFLHIMWYVTGASTIVSAISYIFSKETFKYIKNKNKNRYK